MSEKEYEWQQNELGEYSYQPIKRKFKLPAWLTALVVSVGASAVCLTIYSAAVLPHMRPTTVISYSAASDETAEDGAISAAGFVGMAERLGDSIVSVNVKGQSSGFFSQMVSYGGGTGIVVSSDGYILTSNSALGRQTTGITVTLSTGEQLDAEVVGSDSKIDCAVLKIEKSGLTAVELADSDSALSGMKVAALGRVLSSQLGTTLTQGTICGVNKGVALQGGQTINLLQTDATAPDNTGSALLDSDGKLLGMVTSMISSGSDSIALAIPSNDIMQVVESVTNTAVSPSGLTIGIRGQDAEYGVAIEAVSENSPAAKAGLAEGDLIMKVDGTTVKTVSEINKLRDTHSHGDTMVFTVYRDGETMDISVKLD